MGKKTGKTERLTVTVLPSTKARLVMMSETVDISMGDIVEDALRDYFERKDNKHSAPDMVLDRVNQLLYSNMEIAQAIGKITDMLQAEDYND